MSDITITDEEQAAIISFFNNNRDTIHFLAKLDDKDMKVADLIERVFRRCKMEQR